jgi:CBS domain-containing membrane protein
MGNAGNPFLARTAEDLMTRAVLVIPEEMSLPRAAHLLRRAQVSGAPVVDAAGRCVGVLSATDFLRWAEQLERPGGPAGCRGNRACVCADWQVVEEDELPTDQVRRHMTPNPVTAGPGTPIRQLARELIEARTHRVIIVDERERPVGIVSSTDILAAVTRAGVSRPDEDDPRPTVPLPSARRRPVRQAA